MTPMIALLLAGFAPSDGLERELIFPMNPLHNHSSCVVECPNGDLLVSWYRGSGERRADDVQILGARKRQGADRWSEPFVLADTPGYPDCNPVLFVDPKERLWLIWPVILDHQWESALLKWKRSTSYSGEGPPVWEANDTLHVTPKDLGKSLLEGLNALPLWLASANPSSA